METQMPERLPSTAAECRTLAKWRTLVTGESQQVVATRGRVKQSRISEIELGKVMPRKQHWPALIAAWGLEKETNAEAEFYRMVMTARLDRNLESSLKQPVSETHPLIAAAQTNGEVIKSSCESEGRAAG